MSTALDDLSQLYADTKACARLVGLSYIEAENEGYSRRKYGKGFRYLDSKNQVLTNKELQQRITELVIPPAWQNVWICPHANGHVLATGIDEKGRKQYIYHPKWRIMRDLIKFYRLLIFGKSLPDIRRTIERDLRQHDMSQAKVIAIMLWLLDNTYIRIGNEQYYDQNESIGLTTLTDKNIIVAGPVITLSFTGKSGKQQQITFENARLARDLIELRKSKGPRLFTYTDGTHEVPIESDTINATLHTISGVPISAKDFRTWGGTLLAFDHLVAVEQSKGKAPRPKQVEIEAIDSAAAILGNTRAVARSSYIHPHILRTYGSKDFAKYYAHAAKQPKIAGLDRRETELMDVLAQLFETEFTLLKNKRI